MTEVDPSAFPGPGDTFAQDGAAVVRERAAGFMPEVAVVLGSGLGDAIGDALVPRHTLSFEELPGFPPAGVPGHAGRMVLGDLFGVPAAVFFGRIHLYEGHPMALVTLPVRLLAHLGVRRLVLTNAAGGLDPAMSLGLLMLIRDHINLLGVNPLHTWRHPDGTPAFVDVSTVWDAGYRRVAAEAAEEAGIETREGVYAAVAGPSYETGAEVDMLARLGADAVGMSTVPEAVAAAAFGIRCLGVSCITDVAGTELTHEEVVSVAGAASPNLRAILERAIPEIAAG